VRELLRGARVFGSARKLGRERGLPLAMWKCNEKCNESATKRHDSKESQFAPK